MRNVNWRRFPPINLPMPFSISGMRSGNCSTNFGPKPRRDTFDKYSAGSPFPPNVFRMAQIKIREMPQDERPREKLLVRGAAALTDPELLAILLRTGVPGANAVEVARQLLERYRSLSGLSRCTVREIASIRGIGTTKAIQLVADFGLSQR